MMTPDASTPTVSEDAATPGKVEDASTPPTDAVAPTDAAVPSDAAAATSCPDNACVAPYVCITTPAGYTCRGQFADWPMPDKLPSSKGKPSYAAGPDLVTDNVTKLQWQVSVPRIIPGCTEYISWSDGTKGDRGELCTRAQGKAYCDNLIHAGFEDWRLPSAIELVSLYDMSRENGEYAIDATAFGDTDYGPYVSDSTYAGSPGQAWGVNFYARANYYSASYAGKVRCVRAGAVPSFATPKDRYLVAGDKVTDRATGLVWQRMPSAQKYAAEVTDAGLPVVSAACSAPWRVPTTNELLSLVDYTRSKPAIDSDAFPDTPSYNFWSDVTASRNTVSFESGVLDTYEDDGYVHCVQ